MHDIIIISIQTLLTLGTLCLCRWMLLNESRKEDIDYFFGILPDFSRLRWYRWPEYAHQRRGQHIIETLI